MVDEEYCMALSLWPVFGLWVSNKKEVPAASHREGLPELLW